MSTNSSLGEFGLSPPSMLDLIESCFCIDIVLSRIDSFNVIMALESKNCRSCEGERINDVLSSIHDYSCTVEWM